MPQADWARLLPEASPALLDILRVTTEPVQPPIRSEIFGPQRFAQHGRSLGTTHRVAARGARTASFFPRLQSNVQMLRAAQRYIGGQAATGYDISPAAEWLLDNFHLIEAQLKEVHEGLPRSYFRALPVLLDEPLAGLPRIYGVAWAFVAHTDGAFDEELLVGFLCAYQETRALDLSEIWALPTTLRVLLIENLRRLAERVAFHKAAREVANLCSDRIDACSVATLDEVLLRLDQRGVGPVFLAQIAQRLQDRRISTQDLYSVAQDEWLQRMLPDPAGWQVQQSADQAADNLSVSNAVTSLRAIGDADWPEIVLRTSALMLLMLDSPLFAAEQATTRAQTLQAIEQLARRSGRSELAVAQALLQLIHSPASQADPSGALGVAGHWLHGSGRAELNRALGYQEDLWVRGRRLAWDLALPVYLGSLLLGTLALAGAILLHHVTPGTTPVASPLWLVLAALLMLFPASEAVVALINRLISESVRPQFLPRLALVHGVPPEHRVLVVIPALLTHSQSNQDLAHRLLLHYLANPEREVQFGILSDWSDAASEVMPADAALLADMQARLAALNARHPRDDAGAPRFVLLHRSRRFSQTEQCWIGWERKRGKLEQLLAQLAGAGSAAFHDLGTLSCLAPQTRYVLTLDSDTQLPPGRLRELVGVAAHPHNQPRLDAAGRNVVSGYAILQPRVATPLPAPRDMTLFHWLFAGQCGIDPYSAASSEVYQDLFGEGTFSGKGLLHVQAMHAVLGGRLPDDQVLSHDLLEGSIARCAVVTDITVFEHAPFHADVAASRVHRWTRGDWQLLPFLRHPGRYGLRAINRWKMLDNLRRSLVAPMSLALLLLSLSGRALAPAAALAVLLAAWLAGPLLGAVAAFAPSREDVAWRHFYRQALTELGRALCGGAWHLVQLLQEARGASDALVRALYRSVVSRRHLLQWTTAASAQASAQTRLAGVWRVHRVEPVMALLAALWLWRVGTPHPEATLALCLLWASAPLWTWWVSRPRPLPRADLLAPTERTYLLGIARDTWRLFERCIGPGDRHLPPDNLQTLPYEMLAHRTSPTNIGLYLLSAACARRFGWIGTQDLLARLEATLATLRTLRRHRGHFLNWYDTQSGAPLLPMYVSTVDSGNLSGHLLAVAQACLALAGMPYGDNAVRGALDVSRQRLRLESITPWWAPDSALARLLALPDPLVPEPAQASDIDALLAQASTELAALQATAPLAAALPMPGALAWCLGDHLATLRSGWLDLHAAQALAEPGSAAESAARRLRALATAFEQLAWEADFSFLYHRKRHLLHIGYRVAEQQLDAGFYDLLASESRLTSLLAIAKGDVPVTHWNALGRPFYAVGADAGLRSWSGSMFEYLMPSLVLDEPHGSVLHEACHAAVREQMDFALIRGVPWGISESAYAGQDHTLAYQYAPQGVPRLALRRTPADELVVAPYATALAAQMAPHPACANLAAIEALSPRARYGLLEALDFSPARQAGSEAFTPVATFMSHHQGMSLVALANVLLDGQARRWAMADAHIEAVASLLQERPPRTVSTLYAPTGGQPLQTLLRRAPALLRDVVPGAGAVEPTHMLSNGRYCVTLRANGAGWSRRAGTGLTRWRDDALRDACGSFFFLRWDRQPQPVSITQHPAPDPAAHYHSVFHADRVCFEAHWPEVQAHTTVWVSPEDDIEFRQIEIINLGERALDIELLSAFEPTLVDPRADEAHPAFSNLFLRAEWWPEQQALWWERTPRLASERGMRAAHFLAEGDPQLHSLRLQTRRRRWLGRNRDASVPAAECELPPAGASGPGTLLDSGLDPVSALAVQLRIEPRGKARLTFATAASDDAATLRAVIDKYRQPSHVQRASLMSATLTGIRLRALRISPELFATVQLLTTALVLSLTRAPLQTPRFEGAAPAFCDRRLLWRFGISGDRPLLLVTAGVSQGMGLLRSLAQALRLWSWGGVACDLVVLNSEPTSYQMALQRDIAALRERHGADSAAQGEAVATGFFMLRLEELSPGELASLQALACVRLQADGRPLLQHVQAWSALHERAFEERDGTSRAVLPVAALVADPLAAGAGEFAAASGEFRFAVSARQRPPRPWINVLSNPGFGAQLSEAGGGYTWAVNSSLNQLTGWCNDAVADPPSEWFLLQDSRTLETWSVAPSAAGLASAVYRVAHGQGYSRIGHQRGDLDISVQWCVDAETAVKQIEVRLVNRGTRALALRLVGMVEWLMGSSRRDRSSVHTALLRQRLGGTPAETDPRRGLKLTALLCTQQERSAGFGEGTAFFGMAGAGGEPEDWTCDRRECFDARGRLVLPGHLGQRSGSGLDPCAALSVRIALAPGEAQQRAFLLGYAANPDAARQLAVQAAASAPALRLQLVRQQWDLLLGATRVKTPDPLFDALVNRWLLYQSVSCRLWAKAGFYQAGGATGYRDQLQDTLALAWAAPDLLRQQIVLCASRQFIEGDVQHWWHAPGGAGVRTHFSDDLLWLPYACGRYLRATGDSALLDQSVAFIEGEAIPSGAEDSYSTPTLSNVQASVFEHAARTIDRSLAVGAHGLPLMGSGDWNDGMNRVGYQGRGESVWLGWFLCAVVADFAPRAHARGETARAQRWEAAAQGWQDALEGAGWDGQWYRRAFFDDGQVLGSQGNAEARIDLIAQAWSVLSGVAPAPRQALAMAAIQDHLVDAKAGLIRLLDPPLAHAIPSAGYIQAYPGGVRENGGQYSHGAVWAMMAQAQWAAQAPDPTAAADLTFRYFTWLSPAHRSRDPVQGQVYEIEPYVMAGDICSQPPQLGRGGWSWYTGAAAWMHRAAIESIFGLRLGSTELSFTPCLPSHWPQAEISLLRDGRSMRFVLQRVPAGLALEAVLAAAATAGRDLPAETRVLQPGQALAWTTLQGDSCHVVPLPP